MQVALISASVVCLFPPRYPNQTRDAPTWRDDQQRIGWPFEMTPAFLLLLQVRTPLADHASSALRSVWQNRASVLRSHDRQHSHGKTSLRHVQKLRDSWRHQRDRTTMSASAKRLRETRAWHWYREESHGTKHINNGSVATSTSPSADTRVNPGKFLWWN